MPSTIGPTNATTLTETVTFSEAVTNVDKADFAVVGSAEGTTATVSSVVATGNPGVYTVTLTDVTGNGTIKLQLLNTATVQDTAGNALTAGATGTATTVDHIAPTVTSIAPSTTGPTNATTLTETVTFSEAVTNVVASDFTVTTTDGNATAHIASVTGSGTTYMVTLDQVAGDGSVRLDLKSTGTSIADTATNAIQGGATGATTAVDHTAPTLAITSDVGALKVGQIATITFTFSEDPGSSFAWNGTTGDVTVSGGALSAISGTGLTRTATFTPTAGVNAGTASVSVAAGTYADAATNLGQAGTTPSLTFDTLAPTVTGIAPSTTGPTNATTLTETVTFSEAVTNVVASDFTVTTTDGNATAHIASVTGSGTTYMVTLDQVAGDGAVRLDLKSTGTGIADTATNAIQGGSTGTTTAVDHTAPTLAITSNASTLKAGQTATITFSFSEDPGSSFAWNGTTGDVTVSGGALSAISGSGLTRTATFTPTAGVNAGTASVSVAAGTYADAATNLGQAGTTPSLTFDTLAPTATSIVPSTTGPTNAATLTETVTFSEAVTGVVASDFTVATASGNATAHVASVTGSGTTYTVTLDQVAGDGAVRLDLKSTGTGIADTATNAIQGGSTGTTTAVDHTAPTLAITSNASTLKAGQTATITFSFSEDPGSSFAWNGTTGDVTVSGGALSAISGSGLTRTATFTPTAGVNAGTASVSVAAGTYADAATNLGQAGTTPSLTFDTLAPTVTSITPSTTGPTSATSITERVTFSEAVTGVDASDFTVTATGTAKAAIGSVTAVSATTYDLVLTNVASDGTVKLDLKATGTGIADAAGNLATGYTNGTITTLDNTGPNTPTIALAHDTGTSSSDRLTNDASLIIGRSENGAILYQVDGGAASSSYDPNALADGQHTVSIRELDAVGNSSANAVLSFTLDRTAPKALLAGVSGQTNHETGHTLMGELGAKDAGLVVTVRDGTTVLGTTTADTAGHFSFAFTDTKDGPTHSYSLTASATDAAGNASTSSSSVFAFDYSANRDLFGTVAHDAASHLGQVYALYEGLLGRAPDQAGARYFVDALDHGATLKDVTQTLLTSSEGQSHLNAAGNAAYVEQLYGSVLGRTGDAGGKQGWVTALDQGASRADVADGFVLSSEHLAQLKAGYAAGVYLSDTTASAVARLYHGVLDRAPDAGGLASFAAQAKSTGLAGVAQTMLSSQEFSSTHGNLSDSAFVDSLYVGALGHHADMNATAYWTGQLAQSGRTQVAVQISESAEAQVHLVGVVEQGWHLA
ncbi:Ig-like domain-containing protein [Methylobacterium sp. WL120]|uniref:beta strand repeat-containing protein n=2 Tax=Methylobacterium sp. WL120 TaxID=2603887 RepID=UPI001FEFBB07|nr:Ig-like domain-containing protein [Methylobacterium sp. WL120]